MAEHTHAARSADTKGRSPRAARPAADAGLHAAGNRALGEVLGARPVQRWPDLGGLGDMLGSSGGGMRALGGAEKAIGGGISQLGKTIGSPSIPSLGGGFGIPSVPGLGELASGIGGGIGSGLGGAMPDLGGLASGLPDLGGVESGISEYAGGIGSAVTDPSNWLM